MSKIRESAEWIDLEWRIGELRRTVIDAHGVILAMIWEVENLDDSSKYRRTILRDRAGELLEQLRSAQLYIEANPEVLELVGLDLQTVNEWIEQASNALGQARTVIRRVGEDDPDTTLEGLEEALGVTDELLEKLHLKAKPSRGSRKRRATGKRTNKPRRRQ
jgi:hypothetical protein